MLVAGKINWQEYETAFDVFAQDIYEATEEWWAKNYAPKLPEIVDLPIDTVTIGTNELNFISERWANWVYQEGGNCHLEHNLWQTYGDKDLANNRLLLVIFDNNFPEQDYSHVELPDTVIRDLDFVPRFKGARGRSIAMIIQQKPDYLLWLHENIEDFKLCEEILDLVMVAIAQSDL